MVFLGKSSSVWSIYTAKPRSVWETVEWRRGRRDGVIDGDVMANQYGSGRDGAG